MIESIRYKRIRALKDATLHLQPFTLLIGANGSGKSTALNVLERMYTGKANAFKREELQSTGQDGNPELIVTWEKNRTQATTTATWAKKGESTPHLSHLLKGKPTDDPSVGPAFDTMMRSIKVYKWDPGVLAENADIVPNPQLGKKGELLAAVLDDLKDSHPEKFDELNDELHRALPEFDMITLKASGQGKKQVELRTTKSKNKIPASTLSDGTLFFIGMLCLAYAPSPSQLIGLEEPERGMHPKLLPQVREAMYRLAYPEKYGEQRKPIQVVATTHSPYLLDLFKETPDEIVVAKKTDECATFERLMDMENADDILKGAPLGDIWFSGVLGGVPEVRA